MKATTLIKELQAKIDEYGDLNVTYPGVKSDVNVGDIVVYDEKGNTPKTTEDGFEIYLHEGGRANRD